METPEARSGYVCPECGKMFKTETGYKNHYETAHIETIRNKQCLKKYFVERYDGYPTLISFPTSVATNGNVRGNIWIYDTNGYYNDCNLNNCFFKEEISKDDAKEIITEWNQKYILESENRYQKNLKMMFDEEAKE